MKANQPSPPEQVSVLFKRKTEVVLSKSQSRVRGEMEMGEGKLSIAKKKYLLNHPTHIKICTKMPFFFLT